MVPAYNFLIHTLLHSLETKAVCILHWCNYELSQLLLCTPFSTCSTSSAFLRIFTFFVFCNPSFCFLSACIIATSNIVFFIFELRLHVYFLFFPAISSLCLVPPDTSGVFRAFSIFNLSNLLYFPLLNFQDSSFTFSLRVQLVFSLMLYISPVLYLNTKNTKNILK